MGVSKFQTSLMAVSRALCWGREWTDIAVDIKTALSGAREMAQRLRALTVLAEDSDSIPSNHMMAHNHL